MEHFFLIDSPAKRRECADFIAHLRADPRMGVTVKPYRRNRSQEQNRLYWGVWLAMLADYTGHTAEELHEFFKDKFLQRRAATVLGRTLLMEPTTTSLKVDEFTAYLEQIRMFAAENLGCDLPT